MSKTKAQKIGEYFENSFALELSKSYRISSQIDLEIVSQTLGLTPQEKNEKDAQAKSTAAKVKTKLSTYYGNDSPSSIRIVGPNPKRRKFFSSLYSEFDDSNPSDVLLEFSNKTIPQEKYYGVSLKSISRGKRTVKANLGLDAMMKLFGQSGTGTYWASTFLYNKCAKDIVLARKSDVENNFLNYGLSSKPTTYFSSRWFNKTFVNNLKQGKNLFESDAKQIKQNYSNYFEQELKKLPQDKIKRFIIEDALKEVSLPLYIVATSTGGLNVSYNTDTILEILSSTITVSSTQLSSGEKRILLKKNNIDTLIQIRIKFESGQDMTGSIKVEIT